MNTPVMVGQQSPVRPRAKQSACEAHFLARSTAGAAVAAAAESAVAAEAVAAGLADMNLKKSTLMI